MTGAPVRPEALWTMMKCLKERIIRLRASSSITDITEQQRLDHLLKTKRWNPYCIRHSSITSDSDYLPDYALKKKARWSMNSKQPSRYIKTRMGDELKQKILVHSGIIGEDQIKRRRSILVCPRCDDVNATDNKVCSKCAYPLSPEAYEEIKSAENSRFKDLENGYQEGLRTLEGRIEEEKTRVKNLKEQMATMQEAQKEILDLLRDPIRLAEAVKAN
jgi:integrase/recombinase XerD